jgi:hypothetical protein
MGIRKRLAPVGTQVLYKQAISYSASVSARRSARYLLRVHFRRMRCDALAAVQLEILRNFDVRG